MTGIAFHDLSVDFERLIVQQHEFGRLVRGPMCAKVAASDGMYAGDGKHYLTCGISALKLIMLSLDLDGKTPDAISHVLDYGCGYGRVIRWLAAVFPNARVDGADIDSNAVAAVSELIRLNTVLLKRDLSRSLERAYDLVWVGSVFTHVSESYARRLLRFLGGFLKPGGIVVATTHGCYVAERLKTRSTRYNLGEESIKRLLIEFSDSGYAFMPYKDSTDYGISVVDPQVMIRLLSDEGYETVLFAKQGWVMHQDGFAFKRCSG